MLLSEIGVTRQLYKNPKQTTETEGAPFASVHPTQPSRPSAASTFKNGNDTGNSDDGSRNVLTGSVITSCFIQTTALPNRIELAGNDLTFYDNTFEQGGVVKGDTSRIVFTHDLNSNEGFIIEKRSSIYNTYDNVISWYATIPKAGAHNYMFIGRNALSSDPQRNLNSVHFNVDNTTSVGANNYLNGVFEVEYSEDGVQTNGNQKLLILGNSKEINASLTGFSGIIMGGDGGIAGIGYAFSTTQINVLMYADTSTRMRLGADLIPDTNGAYDIGSPSFKIDTLYGSVVACPLPTVENALEILERIPEPTFVGERGHYGEDKKYFDDLTFPEEVLYKNEKKGLIDIEHNHMLGFLLKAVIELNQKVKDLQSQEK